MLKKTRLELSEHERALGSKFTKTKLEAFLAEYLAKTEGYDVNKAIEEASKVILSDELPFKFKMQINDDN